MILLLEVRLYQPALIAFLKLINPYLLSAISLCLFILAALAAAAFLCAALLLFTSHCLLRFQALLEVQNLIDWPLLNQPSFLALAMTFLARITLALCALIAAARFWRAIIIRLLAAALRSSIYLLLASAFLRLMAIALALLLARIALRAAARLLASILK